MVGAKIFNAFYPDRYYNHDAEDPDGMVHLGKTDHDEPVNINRRCVESDLVIYVNINLVPMDGGHKSVAVGLCDYEALRPHHEPETIRDSDSYMDPKRSMLNTKVERLGALVDRHMNVFHIETALNNRMFAGPTAFLSKNEDEFTEFDRLKFEAMRWTLSKMPRAAKRKLFHSIPAQYQLIACYAGKTEPVHEKILKHCWEQYGVNVEGQADILICGSPVHLALQRQLDPEPAAGAGDGAGLLPQLLPGQAAAEEGRGDDPDPPLLRRVRPQPPPELHRVLQPAAARDARRDEAAAQVRGGVRQEPELHRDVPARATPTTAPTRSSCGTGARTAASTSAR